jgi:hypothetical protein
MDFSPSIFDQQVKDDVLTIRTARCQETRRAANRLLQERYRWRGYCEVELPADNSRHFSLLATRDGLAIGTLTVGLDGPDGLGAERTFGTEIRALRARGCRLSEFTRLALDPELGSRQVLASLFHVAYLTAARLCDADVVVMEVNPRHVAYYVRVLDAQICGPTRTHAAVNAPAVLLSIRFEDVRGRIEQVLRYMDEGVRSTRSPYAMALGSAEENAILDRLSRHADARDGSNDAFYFRMPGPRVRSQDRAEARASKACRGAPAPG